MGKEEEGAETQPSVTDQASEIWSKQEPAEAQDDDQIEPDLDLTRTASGPPYSIFSTKAKYFIVVSVSIAGLISPFGAVTFYPALNVLARVLDVTPAMINIALTTYMASICRPNMEDQDLMEPMQIAQAIAPSFIAGMSDKKIIQVNPPFLTVQPTWYSLRVSHSTTLIRARSPKSMTNI